ncbi:MAG: hypothetical protein N2999_06715 [Proteobacteria bacterium]|nr:hypothetical protein [Pseudomonadota bacterium]
MINLEIFFTFINEQGKVLYFKERLFLEKMNEDPDLIVLREVEKFEFTPYLIHSTSWRYEEDTTLTLTYIALCKFEGKIKNLNFIRELENLKEPAESTPLKPRPKKINEVDVLSHAIKHINLLTEKNEFNHLRKLIDFSCLKSLLNQKEISGRLL